MRTKPFWLTVAGATVSLVCALIFVQAGGSPVNAQAQNGDALTGRVTSVEEGPMEGVLVRAKKAGSNITVTVVSDAQGRYRFPRTRLEPGQYGLRIRAVGYDLDSAGTVDIAAQKTTTADLKLRKADDLASQLTSAEWLQSLPTAEQKNALQGCTVCHTVERIVRSRYDKDAFVPLLARMSAYGNQAFPLKPQFEPLAPQILSEPPTEQRKRQAAMLATVNLSAGPTWNYALKTMPRPKGKATQVIYTEYDLPQPTIQPHDVILDKQGMVWFNDFGGQSLFKMDPKTGQIKEYAMPTPRPGVATGTLDIEFDKDENIWSAMMYQDGIEKFDRKTETFQVWGAPDEYKGRSRITRLAPGSAHVDGKVWVVNTERAVIHRLTLATNKWETFAPYGEDPAERAQARGTIYGILPDSQNNLFFLLLSGKELGRIDAKTGAVKIFQIPLENAGPRRGRIDSQDRFWFAAWRGNAIGMFDTKAEKFQMWPLSTAYSWPYDAIMDKSGEVWAGGMHNDRVQRLNPKTNEIIDYLLPRETNIRRVFVDNSTAPGALWVGGNHSAYVVKVEALDASPTATH